MNDPRILFLLSLACFATATAQGLGVWELLAPAPTARQEVGVGAIDGKVYVVGGFANGVSTNTVERYDVASDEWESVAPLPAPSALNHVGVAVTGGRLYVVGGLHQNFSAVASVYVYDPVSGEWSEVDPLPQARGAMGIAVIDGRIYAAGGLPAARNRLLSAYDPAANEWTSLSDMPTGRDHLAAAELNGRLYAFSGRANGVLMAATEIYDPTTDEWSTGAPIPTPRGGIAAAVVGTRAYVFGGEGNDEPGSNGVFDDVEEYDPATNAWRAMTPMPEGRHGIGAASHASRIHIPVGSPFEGLGQSERNDAFTPPMASDADADGIADSADNCTLVANADQRDTDGDGYGNVCDPDLDGNGSVNFTDLGLLKAVFFGTDPNADFDGDGNVNFADLGVMKAYFFLPPGPSGLITDFTR